MTPPCWWTPTVTVSTVFAPGTGGRDVVAAPLSLRWQAPGVGTIALAYAYTDTLHPGGNDAVVHSLRSDEWIGGYGRRVAEHVAAGFTLRLTSGTIVSDSHPLALGGLPLRSETHFLAPDFSGERYTLIEANERPGLANHEPQPTAERFIDFLFPETREKIGEQAG